MTRALGPVVRAVSLTSRAVADVVKPPLTVAASFASERLHDEFKRGSQSIEHVTPSQAADFLYHDKQDPRHSTGRES